MPADGAVSDRDPAPALSRGIRILEALAAANGQPVALTDIARSISAAKSSTSNLCSVLEDAALIRRVDGGYVLGFRTVELGGAYVRTFNEVQEFYRFCAEAPTLAEEIVQIAMLDGTDVVYLARHEGVYPLRLTATIGDRFPAAPTAVGNALLAALPDEEIAARFQGPEAFPRRTERSVVNLAGLMAKLIATRERGYAVDENEVHPGISGIAVRIPPRSSSAPALSLGCTFLTAATSDVRRAAIVADLQALAHQLSNPMQLTLDA